jgi:hypothetical protein
MKGQQILPAKCIKYGIKKEINPEIFFIAPHIDIYQEFGRNANFGVLSIYIYIFIYFTTLPTGYEKFDWGLLQVLFVQTTPVRVWDTVSKVINNSVLKPSQVISCIKVKIKTSVLETEQVSKTVFNSTLA